MSKKIFKVNISEIYSRDVIISAEDSIEAQKIAMACLQCNVIDMCSPESLKERNIEVFNEIQKNELSLLERVVPNEKIVVVCYQR